MADHNTAREAQLHDDRKSYRSETDAIFSFPGEAAGHKNGHMLHRKFMWQDHPTPHGANPLNRLTYSKQAENLFVGKTKSYWTINSKSRTVKIKPVTPIPRHVRSSARTDVKR
jgi:hypothetical protein